MNKKTQILISGLCGFSAVAIGAFGAHGLRNVLNGAELDTFHTGVLYHLIHSAVLLALALNGSEKFKSAFIVIFTGTILFPFSLYAYSITGITALAFITPLGGVSFLIGWLLIAYKAVKG